MVELDAVVIGGGFAGLSAALTLEASGLRTVVLEAGSRPGGRARTDYELRRGGPCELGAQMIHGRRAVTHEWVRRCGLHARIYPVMPRSRIVVDRRVGRYPWFALPFHPVVGFRAAIQARFTVPSRLQSYTGPDVSLEKYLNDHPIRPGARRIVELLHAHVYAADPGSIGVKGPSAEDRASVETLGYTNFQMVEGYSALADRVARELGERLRLGRAVVSVETNAQGVRVRARALVSQAEEEYRAAAAVVTVPLGVLKAGDIAFDPPLPGSKQRAIERIAIADAFALHLRVRGGTMRRRLGDFAMLWGGTPSSFYRPGVGLHESTEVVTAFTVGREAARLAALTVPEIVEATQREWESVVPSGVTLGTVEAATVHLWTNDRRFRGAYSYLPTGAGLDDRSELAAHVGNRLFFAGEATDVRGQSATVAGAIDSGRRAAEEVRAATVGTLDGRSGSR
jgi:monoamine oxidase